VRGIRRVTSGSDWEPSPRIFQTDWLPERLLNMIAEVYGGFPMPLFVAVIVPIAFVVWRFFLRGKDSG